MGDYGPKRTGTQKKKFGAFNLNKIENFFMFSKKKKSRMMQFNVKIFNTSQSMVG